MCNFILCNLEFVQFHSLQYMRGAMLQHILSWNGAAQKANFTGREQHFLCIKINRPHCSRFAPKPNFAFPETSCP